MRLRLLSALSFLILCSGMAVSSHSEVSPIQDALNVLSRSHSGQELLMRAQKLWKLESREALSEKFAWGEVSRTDAVLTRNFDPETGKETRRREVTIYIRKGQGLEDLVLDIAHELTHAIHEPSWDPYDPHLSASRYMWASLEGQGGEVDALVSECKVALELLVQLGPSASRCLRYREGATPGISREKVREDFYRVGQWLSEILAKLGPDARFFPKLSPDAPQLFSSTGQAPYPLALLREFEELNRSACENSRKRLDAIVGRSIASQASAQRDLTLRFLKHRCH